MVKICKFCFFLVFLCWSTLLPAQLDRQTGLFQQKIKENHNLLMVDPEKAFTEIDVLLKEAVQKKMHKEELLLLSRRAWFYIRKLELEKAIEAAKILESKSIAYKDYYYESVAHQHLMEVYSSNSLTKKAIEEFQKSMELLEKADRNNSDINYAKATSYLKLAGIYQSNNDFKKAKEILKKANKEAELDKDFERKRKFLFFNYSNLGLAYSELGILDSSEHYVKKSMALKKQTEEASLIQFRNYLFLGELHFQKKGYDAARINFKKAEKIEQHVTTSAGEKEKIYSRLASIYKALDSSQQVAYYNNKFSEMQLEIERNRNKSLHKIINENLLKEKNYSVYIILGASLIVLLLSGLLYRSHKKNKLLAQQEKVSEEYLDHIEPVVNEQTYQELVNMLKNNDPAFISSFLEKFTDFSEKLQSINPKIVQTEVEFSAMLKLNLLTKEIARYKNIEPRTVQNKKYLIRKKLNIPKDMDIYYWFSQL